MELTSRETWAVIHGLVLGALLLLAFNGALAGLWSFRPGLITTRGVQSRVMRLNIGVAMGRSGTEVAREAATMVLTDDNFASIVTAVEAGRRVYDNVRKLIVYIFAHATPEVVPFLVYALSGGQIPLPLTVMQILAIDLGTETLPALALGRERAEPGLMERPPRKRGQNVIDAPMLVRAWAVLGSAGQCWAGSRPCR